MSAEPDLDSAPGPDPQAWRKPAMIVYSCAYAAFFFAVAFSFLSNSLASTPLLEFSGSGMDDVRIYAAIMAFAFILAGTLFCARDLLAGEWLSRARLPWINKATVAWGAGASMLIQALVWCSRLTGRAGNEDLRMVSLASGVVVGLAAVFLGVCWELGRRRRRPPCSTTSVIV